MSRPELRLIESAADATLPELLAAPPGDALRLWWLGQAGFVIEGDGRRLVIDPYLSDSLAEKYRGTCFPHERMMPPPVSPDEIRHVDLVLATHAHTDHLDAGTLPTLLAGNPLARLVAPRAARDVALERAGIPSRRLIPVDAGDDMAVLPGLGLRVTRAAHEDLKRDAEGRHVFLGLALQLGGACLFHSGDTVPFDGQNDEVRALDCDLALFPVNGRDETRAANGVPGNMDLSEAIALARAAAIPSMIAHHFDLFDFNTVARSSIAEIARKERSVCVKPAQVGVTYLLSRSGV